MNSVIKQLLTLTSSCIFLALSSTNAQICSGSLGDAVVNVTFGAGTNPGSPLPGAETSYQFISGDCPQDGSYTVINATNSCFGSTWHSLTEDHTPGDINGYMMLVNASIDTGDFYVHTVSNLCSGTTYEFSAWIVNVLKNTSCSPDPKHPRLKFNIETTTGQILGSYSTGDIYESSSPVWQQYGLFFTTPLNTSSVVIRLTNNAPGGCGNDLALDDITFRPCGPAIKATVVSNGKSEFDECINNAAMVNVFATVGTGYIQPALQWQESLNSGQSWQDIAGAVTSNLGVTRTAVGKYQYRLTAAENGNIGLSNCRVASNPITITIHNLPVVTAANNSPVCEGTSLQLSAGGGATYSWNGPGAFTSTLASPSFSPALAAAGLYTVVAKDIYGCASPGFTTVSILPKPIITTSTNKDFCLGDSARLFASGGNKYLWKPSEGLSDPFAPNPVARPLQTTIYDVRITDLNNCSDSGSVKVTVYNKPVVSAGEDKIIIRGNTIVLNGSIAGDSVNFNWTPNTFLTDASQLQAVSKPTSSITYILTAASVRGCGIASDSVFVKVYNGIYIPTAFSPNRDGLNETWKIEALAAYPTAAVTIFNRFGEVIYFGRGASAIWDGTFKGEPSAAGAYVYVIDLKNNSPALKGTVILLR